MTELWVSKQNERKQINYNFLETLFKQKSTCRSKTIHYHNLWLINNYYKNTNIFKELTIIGIRSKWYVKMNKIKNFILK